MDIRLYARSCTWITAVRASVIVVLLEVELIVVWAKITEASQDIAL